MAGAGRKRQRVNTVMIKTIGASPNFHHLSEFSEPRVKNPRFEVYLHSQVTFSRSD